MGEMLVGGAHLEQRGPKVEEEEEKKSGALAAWMRDHECE